ncbi:ATPase [Cryptotrichosporon argae]
MRARALLLRPHRPRAARTLHPPAVAASRARQLSSTRPWRQQAEAAVEEAPRSYAQSRRAMQEAEAKASFTDPMTRYEHLVDTGVLRADPHQKTIVRRLQRLWEDLKGYDPGPVPGPSTAVEPSYFGKFFTRKPATPAPTVPLSAVPRGLYLYGSVGTGKTMLMDLLHSTLPPQFDTARYGATRVHFHAFMIDVLKRQHAVAAKYAEMGEPKKDALPEVARGLAEKGRVLCFDEFQVTDIVTAMLLRGLLERLMDFGVVCVMTSNRHPDELYINGIQRESFIPAIELIKERFEVVDLNSGTDYRKMPRTLSKTYYHPLTPEVDAELDKIFAALAEADGGLTPGRRLHLWGRELRVPQASAHVARFSFADLCDRPLSAADYLEITRQFGTVFVLDVPKMGLSERDQARRFITFIDACYENKTRLFVSSEAPIFQIFSDDRGKAAADDAHMRSVMDDLGIQADVVGSSSLFSGDEELFAFARCVSRLSQMGTKEWTESSGL